MDFFQGTSVTVEPEVDLSVKHQYLDLVIIHKGKEPIPRPLPDGFEQLAAHNLITFKSHQEALDAWALQVNYRKQSSPSLQELLPESDYQLFAVAARYPQQLAQQIELKQLSEGVHEIKALALNIRVVVASGLPQEEHNAMLHLFSAREELLRYGREHYRPHSTETSSLLYELFKTYSEESTMPDKLKEFVRKTVDELLKSLPPQERLKGMSPDDVLAALSPEARAALVQRLKDEGALPASETKRPEQGN
jgi:hypothetical protein